jgi:hypothetical protein
MNLCKDPESWARVDPEAVVGCSHGRRIRLNTTRGLKMSEPHNHVSAGSEELDLCPICRSRLVGLFEREDGLFIVSCENDDNCQFTVQTIGGSAKEAVRKWNTRITVDAQPVQVPKAWFCFVPSPPGEEEPLRIRAWTTDAERAKRIGEVIGREFQPLYASQPSPAATVDDGSMHGEYTPVTVRASTAPHHGSSAASKHEALAVRVSHMSKWFTDQSYEATTLREVVAALTS